MTEDTPKKIEDNNAVGLGVDIVDLSRMKEIIERTPNFVEHTFSTDEINYCNKSKRNIEHYATHFAAKEAVLKALGCGFAEGISPKDIEVVHDEKGKPSVVLSGRALELSKEQGVKDIPISLSFSNTEAVGFAIALTEESSFPSEVLRKNIDPMAELKKQFKEAKKILDEQN